MLCSENDGVCESGHNMNMCKVKEGQKEHINRYYSKRKDEHRQKEEKWLSASGVDVSIPVLESIINLQQKYPKCYNELALIRKTIMDTAMAKYVTVSIPSTNQ